MPLKGRDGSKNGNAGGKSGARDTHPKTAHPKAESTLKETFIIPVINPAELAARRQRRNYIIISFLIIAAALSPLIYWGVLKEENIAQERDRERLRAYLFPRAFLNIEVPDVAPFVIQIPVQNTGLTPAYNVLVHYWTQMTDYPPERGFKPESGKDRWTRSMRIESGGENRNMIALGITDPEEMKQVVRDVKKDTDTAIYFAGTISYRDIFGDKHTSDFCLGYHGVDGIMAVFYDCPHHNNAN